MDKLITYLDKYDNNEIHNTIYNQYLDFGYPNEELYTLHLNYMLKNLYNIHITEKRKKRLGQKEFRSEILKKFNNKCLITGQTCDIELEAAHIIPLSDNENYDIDNGLLLLKTLHSTFDNYKWAINPDTLMIEIKNNQNVGSIKEYENKKISLVMNEKLYNNLKNRYMAFKLN